MQTSKIIDQRRFFFFPQVTRLSANTAILLFTSSSQLKTVDCVWDGICCMQQLRERYASRTCYNARASLWRQSQGLKYAQSQPTVSSTLMHRFQLLLTRRGEQGYTPSVAVQLYSHTHSQSYIVIMFNAMGYIWKLGIVVKLLYFVSYSFQVWLHLVLNFGRPPLFFSFFAPLLTLKNILGYSIYSSINNTDLYQIISSVVCRCKTVQL